MILEVVMRAVYNVCESGGAGGTAWWLSWVAIEFGVHGRANEGMHCKSCLCAMHETCS